MNSVAQLVPLDESSVALVASLLTLTVSTAEGEFSLESSQSESIASAATALGATGSFGQSMSRRAGGVLGGIDEAERAGESLEDADPGSSTATPWERFMLGLDKALEDFRREFQSRIGRPETRETDRQPSKPEPAADSSPPGVPTGYLPHSDTPANGSGDALDEGAELAGRGEAVDASIDLIWHDDDSRLGRPSPTLRGAPRCRCFRLRVRAERG